MSVSEIVFGVLLVIGLVALSLYFGWRQFASLRRLRVETDIPDEERLYERRKAIRRLISCALTLLMAGLIGWLLASYDSTAGLVEQQRRGVDPAEPFTDQQRFLFRLWGGAWIAVLVVLLLVLILAALDLWATRRFAIGQYRKIAGDRRSMIQREVNRMRQDRNGEYTS